MADGSDALRHVIAVAKRNPHDADAQQALRDVVPGLVPVCAAVAVAAFEVLSSARGEGLNGPAAITMPAVAAYSQHVAPLTSREVRWVLAMDAAFRDELATPVTAEAAHG